MFVNEQIDLIFYTDYLTFEDKSRFFWLSPSVIWTPCKTFTWNVNWLNITLENTIPLLYLSKFHTIGM